MRYEVTTKNGSLRPKAASILANLGDAPLYNEERGLRHPLGIYNFTLEEVITKINTLLDAIETAKTNSAHGFRDGKTWDEELLDSADHMLDSIMQHLDSFKSIICCFYPESDSKKLQKTLRSLTEDIREYRDHVAQIVNLIKHNQRKLSAIMFYGPGILELGYYVEGVLPGGAIGPDPKIHTNSNVAISFNRDIPFHLCNIYYCSAALSTTIHKICGATPAISQEDSKYQENLEKLLKRASELPMVYFPDEISKPTPMVRAKQKNNSEHLDALLEMPSRKTKAKAVTQPCRIKVSFKGDGVSRSFKMPYFGTDQAT